MDNTRDITQDREEDVYEQVRATTALEEDSKRREEDGEDDFDDITGGSVSADIRDAARDRSRRHPRERVSVAREGRRLPAGERHGCCSSLRGCAGLSF